MCIEAGLQRIVTVRKFTRGKALGITSNEAKHAEVERASDKWIFLDLEPNELEKRRLMAGNISSRKEGLWGPGSQWPPPASRFEL